MLSGLGQRLEGVGDGRRSGGNRQRCAAIFQRRDSGFKHALGRVCQSAVDVAGIPQSKAVSSMIAAMEHVGSRCVNRNGAGVGYRIGLFLTNMQLFGFKGPVRGILNI